MELMSLRTKPTEGKESPKAGGGGERNDEHTHSSPVMEAECLDPTLPKIIADQ